MNGPFHEKIRKHMYMCIYIVKKSKVSDHSRG